MGDAGAWRVALHRLLKTLSRVGALRLLATTQFLALALLAARFSWEAPLAVEAERALYDLRVVNTVAKTDPDPRIVMVVYNDDTLLATRKRSPLDRATLARALTNLDAMGARAIGIDILIDQPQDEDAALIAAFRAMRTPTWLAYADNASNAEDIQYNQQQFLDGFQAAVRSPSVRATSIRLEADPDNVVRRWPDIRSNLPPFMAIALAPSAEFADYDGAIRWRMPAFTDRPAFDTLPIDLFAGEAVIPAFAEQIRGRYVLIGTDIIDVDKFETPLREALSLNPGARSTTAGLEVHAHMLAQRLDGAAKPRVPSAGLWAIAALVVVAGALSSLLSGAWWRMGLFLTAQAVFFLYLPILLERQGVDTLGLPAFGWAVGWFMAFAAVGAAARAVGAEQRKFAQGALGKYLPRDIANEIMADPERLALHGERCDIFVVFTDLEGFTKLSHAIEPEMVAYLLNNYLDRLSDIVLEHGGTIDKFVGDAIIAFWGAPIKRPDDGERAARAALAMAEAGETFRRETPEGVPPIGRTRVGLHYGEAIVGNFGGEGRIQYTALGDPMNTASRLEAANKQLKTTVLASWPAVQRSGVDWWRPMGRVLLRGRSTPVEIFEPAPQMSVSDLRHFRSIMTRVNEGKQDAVAELRNFASKRPEDATLGNLVYRLDHIGDGGSYVLD